MPNPFENAKKKLEAEAASAQSSNPFDRAKARLESQPAEKGWVDKGVDYLKESVDAGEGALQSGGKLLSNVSKGNVFTDENAGLAVDTIRKGTRAATPLLIPAAALGAATVGVVPTAVGMIAGYAGGALGGEVAKRGAKALGASENVTNLAEEVGSLAGGSGAALKVARGAARRMASTGYDRARAGIPAKQEAAQIAAQRNQVVKDIEGEGPRKLFQRDEVRTSPGDSMVAAYVQAEAPAINMTARAMKKGGATKGEVADKVTQIENLVAQAGRPDTKQISVIEQTNLEGRLKELAPKRIGDVPGLEQFDRYASAMREVEQVKMGILDPKDLPPPVGNTDRMTENLKLVQAFDQDFSPIRKELDDIVLKGIVEPAVKAGLLSPNAAAKMSTFKDYVKWNRPFEPVEQEAMAGMGNLRKKPVFGIGEDDPLPFMHRYQQREPKPVVQATLDQMQEVAKDGAKNQILQLIANEGQKWDPVNGGFTGGKSLPELMMIPGGTGPKNSKVWQTLKPQLEGRVGTARVMFDGKEHTLIGPPAYMNALNSFDQVSAEVGLKMWPWARAVSGGANRLFKMATTGVLAPARKGVNMVYNLAQVYQQLPLSATPQVLLKGAKYGMEFLGKELGRGSAKGSSDFQRLRKEGLEQAAFGTSSEIVRGVGEKNIDYMVSKGSPAEFARHVFWEPLKEVGKAAVGKPFDRKVITQMGHFMDEGMRYIEDIASADEVGLKMAVYDVMEKQYLKQGRDPKMAKELAAWDARNIITDFTRRGTFTRNFDILGMPFFQAAISGMRTNVKFAAKDPIGFTGRTLAPFLAHSWVTYNNFADPAKARIVNDISEDFLTKNLVIIPDPSKVKRDEFNRFSEGIIVIPYLESPFSRSAAAGVVEIAKQQNPIQNAAASLVMYNMAKRGAKHWLPVEPDPIQIASQVPILGPASEIARNEDTYSKVPIVNNRSMARAPEWALQMTGGDRKKAAQLLHFINKSVPSLRHTISSPQRPGSDEDSLASEWLRQFRRPFTSAPGGNIRRSQKEK